MLNRTPVVTALFYNFHPQMVARAIPDAWSYASPAALLDARLAAMDGAMRRVLAGDLSLYKIGARVCRID